MSKTDDSADADAQHESDSTDIHDRVLTVDPDRAGETVTVISTTNDIISPTHEAEIDEDGVVMASQARTAFMADSYRVIDE